MLGHPMTVADSGMLGSTGLLSENSVTPRTAAQSITGQCGPQYSDSVKTMVLSGQADRLGTYMSCMPNRTHAVTQ